MGHARLTPPTQRPRLLILRGLPGTGKTTLARALAVATGDVYLRIDTIETAIRTEGLDVGPAGYRVAYSVARDNLRLGRNVIADSVNPIAITRTDWREVALDSGADAEEVEVICSDRAEHQRRVEARISDIPGLVPPPWEKVCVREYDEVDDGAVRVVVVDTAQRDVNECVAFVLSAIAR